MTHPVYFEQMFQLGLDALAQIVARTDVQVPPTALLWFDRGAESAIEDAQLSDLSWPIASPQVAALCAQKGRPAVVVVYGEAQAPVEDNLGRPDGVGPIGLVYARDNEGTERSIVFRIDRSLAGTNRLIPYNAQPAVPLSEWSAAVLA